MRVLLDECSWSATLSQTNLLDLKDYWAPAPAAEGPMVFIVFTARKVGFKVLGCMLSFNNDCGIEVTNRIAAAWGAFNKHQALLTS